MNNLSKWLEEKFVPPLMKFASMKYVQILQRTFVSCTALLLVGSFMLLIKELPIPNWQEIIGADTIALIGRLTGVGSSYISIYVAISTSYIAIDYYNKNNDEDVQPIPAMLLSLVSFIIMTPPVLAYTETGEVFGWALPYAFLGAKGIFSALIIALITVEIYRYFIKHNLVIKMPEGVPPMVIQAFAAIIPTLAILLMWWAIRYVLDINVLQVILDLFLPLVKAGDNIFAAIILPFINRVLWTIGIHGAAVTGVVTGSIFTTMNLANQAAAEAGEVLPYIASGVFYDCYVWVGLEVISISLMLTKSKRLKAIGALSLLPAIFNIGEPLLFGVPIVLNPILAIPWILSTVVVSALAYGLCAAGILATPYLMIPWTTPGPIKAFLSCGGHISGLIWCIAAYVIIFAIYYPFIKMVEKQEMKEELPEETI